MGDGTGLRARARCLLAAGGLVVAVALASGCGGDDGGTAAATGATGATAARTAHEPTAAERAKAAQLETGRRVFVASCGGCHTLKDAGTTGTTARGNSELDPIQPNYSSTKWFVVHGFKEMPSYRGRLDRTEIEAVSRYVSTVTGGGPG